MSALGSVSRRNYDAGAYPVNSWLHQGTNRWPSRSMMVRASFGSFSPPLSAPPLLFAGPDAGRGELLLTVGHHAVQLLGQHLHFWLGELSSPKHAVCCPASLTCSRCRMPSAVFCQWPTGYSYDGFTTDHPFAGMRTHGSHWASVQPFTQYNMNQGVFYDQTNKIPHYYAGKLMLHRFRSRYLFAALPDCFSRACSAVSHAIAVSLVQRA